MVHAYVVSVFGFGRRSGKTCGCFGECRYFGYAVAESD